MFFFWVLCYIINSTIIFIWWLKNGTSVKVDSVLFTKHILMFMFGPIVLFMIGLIFSITIVDKIFGKVNVTVSPDIIKNFFSKDK